MSNKKLEPEIRFEGFEGEWENSKLPAVTDITMGQSPAGSSYTNNPDDMILVQGNADIMNGKITPRVWTTEGTKRASKGDIIFTVRAPVGDVAKTDFDVVLGRGVAGLEGNDFLYYQLERLKSKDFWTKMSTGSTFQSINSKHLEDLSIRVTGNQEQKKIGEFFECLETNIQSKNSELSALINFKQAMLQKMFPKEGETIPEIRFEGFEGEWVRHRLGDFTSVSTGDSDLQDSIPNGKYPFFVRSDNIQRSDRYLYDGEAILIPGEGRLGEIFHYINGKFDYHQRVYKISDFINNDAKFTTYYMKRDFKKHALKNTSKATVDSLRLDVITNFKIPLPSIEEQKLISVYFYNLESNIHSKQADLKKLKQFKQAMLDKMFV